MKNKILTAVPLLPAQQQMLVASLKSDKKEYIQQLVFRVNSKTAAKEKTTSAINRLVDRFECLNSLVLYDGLKSPMYVTVEGLKNELTFVQWDQSIELFIDADLNKGFSLQKEPLIRFQWIENQEGEYLVITNHHLLYDGWGKQFILSDFVRFFQFESLNLIKLKNRPWYDAWLKLDHKKALSSYERYLFHSENVASLSKIGDGINKKCTHTNSIDTELIKKIAKKIDATHAETFNFLWSLFLFNWTQEKNIRFGVVKQNGLIGNVDNGFGLGIQTIPLVYEFKANSSLSEEGKSFVFREREIAPFSYVDVSNEIFNNLNFDVIIAFENYPIDKLLKESVLPFDLVHSYDFSEFPLSIAITPNTDSYIIDWHFQSNIHCEEQIFEVSEQFLLFINYISEIDWNSNGCVFELEKFSCNLFTSQLNPEIFFERVFHNLEYSTGYSSDFFYQLEIFLIQQCQKKIIWIVGDKNELTPLILLAAWKNSITVYTINENESIEFIKSLFEQKPDFLIGEKFSFLDVIQFNWDEILTIINLEKSKSNELDFSIHLNESFVALCVCTSGTTGTPKVVQLSLNNLIGFFHALDNQLIWPENISFTAIAHPAFDIGIVELIFPIFKKYKLTLLKKSEFENTEVFYDKTLNSGAFHMVPSLLINWLENAKGDDVERIIMTGGDKVPTNLFQRIHGKFPKTYLFQGYGPSECSVLITGFENSGQFNLNWMPIGNSLSHGKLNVLSTSDILLPAFQIGELAVCGNAVGLGYYNMEDHISFLNLYNNRFYKTGDLGFHNGKGDYFFEGRKDNQIKINGQRIEIARIELVLRKNTSLNSWIVIYDEGVLAAFYESKEELKNDFQKELTNDLPFYAIPQTFIRVDEYKLNKNGKIDFNQLKIVLKDRITKLDAVIIKNEYINLIQELFPTKNINYNLSWFSNGLNSLDALKFASKIKSTLGFSLNIKSVLSATNFDFLNRIENEIAINDIKIKNELLVQDASSRLFFLSESDEILNKSYCIHFAFIIDESKGFNQFVKKWLENQNNLFWKVQAKESNYLWLSSEVKIVDYIDLDEMEFVHKIKSDELLITDSLMKFYFSKSVDNELIGIKVHHGLLDGMGVQELFKVIVDDFHSNKLNQISLISGVSEDVDHVFWENYLKKINVKELPFSRNQSIENKKCILRFKLSEQEIRKIEQVIEKNNCSYFEAFLLLWSKLWYNYFPMGDFSTGIVVNSKDKMGEASTIYSNSVNTLPFVIDTDSEVDLINKWRTLSEKRSQSFAKLSNFESNKQIHGKPFFNTSIVFNESLNDNFPDFIQAIEFSPDASIFDLSIDILKSSDEIQIQWEFDSTQFSIQAIEFYHNLLLFGDLPQLNHTSINSTSIFSLSDIYRNVVEEFSGKNALSDENESISYNELTNRIKLFNSKIVYSGSGVIPLILDRNVNSVVAIISCLINEIPFIPIDSSLPKERIAQIENVVGTKSVSISEINEVDEFRVKPLDAWTPLLVYGIATSGTTGVPKLVGVRRNGYISLIEAWKKDYSMTSNDKCLQAASFSFDVFLGDIGRSIFNGAELILLSDFERKDPEFIIEKIVKKNISVFETTPLIAKWWISSSNYDLENVRLRLLIIGSDSWRISEFNQLKEKLAYTRVISSYGLSEATIDNSFMDYSNNYSDELIVPIGKPMFGSEISIVDENRTPLKRGLKGYIAIKGLCVGNGYLEESGWSNLENDSWFSADRGVLDEFGNFHFLGRSDRQVKVRGQRIELQEVESLLIKCDNTREWIVFDFQTDFNTEIAAGYLGEELSDIGLNEIKSYFIEKYPSYFLPSHIFKIAEIKTNSNGKLDLNYLKTELQKNIQSNKLLKIIDSELVEQLCDVYNQLFKIEIQPENNFFEFGRNSFDAMSFVREWNLISSLKIKVHFLFISENMQELAMRISNVGPAIQKNTTQKNRRRVNKAQEALWFTMQNTDTSLFNLPHFIEIPNEYKENLSEILSQTIRQTPELFCSFMMGEDGNLYEIQLDSSNFNLEMISLNSSELDLFKEKAFHKEFNFNGGILFEVNLIFSKDFDKTILYFNAHHMIYDGGSDAVIYDNFIQVKSNNSPKNHLLNEFKDAEIADLKVFFDLSDLPKKRFNDCNHSLSLGSIFKLNSDSTASIKKLCQQWKCSSAVVFSAVLKKGFDALNIQLDWISLMVDIRDFQQIGMFMRAFPFPALAVNEENSTSVSKLKWALSTILKHKNDQIIYPDGADVNLYHQIGLVIQHPVEIDGFEYSFDENQLSRPRLPLTLYVDQINDDYYFRWEFDSSIFSKDLIQKMQKEMTLAFDDLLMIKQESLVFESNTSYVSNQSINFKSDQRILDIWNKYSSIKNGDHFFYSGGSSVQALIMLSEIKDKLELKFSITEFFKNPTLSFLSKIQNFETKHDGLMIDINTSGRENIWLFPPIFGLGLIFNSLNYAKNNKSFSCNYPSAIELDVTIDSIQELAYLLFQQVLIENRDLENITLVGYSMGGIVAFEAAKLIEKNKGKIKKLIILDKTAHINNDDVKGVSNELDKYIDLLSISESDKIRMVDYLSNHMTLINSYLQKDKIEADITIYYCGDKSPSSEILDWSNFTSGKTDFIHLKEITHYEIPNNWNSVFE